uniref:TAZ-type domain-containing protein n=1 Tax=Ascaris lumbricoides TaxID=6252 RepID=A0A0M3IFR4_ASCLU
MSIDLSPLKHLSKLRLHMQNCTHKICSYPKCSISKYLEMTRRRFFVRITMSIPRGKQHSCTIECANQPYQPRRCNHLSKLRLHMQNCTHKICSYPKCSISKYLEMTRRRFFVRITMSIPRGKQHSCTIECANQPCQPRRCNHNIYEALIPIAPWRWNYAKRPSWNLKSKKKSANFEWRLKPFRIHQRLYFLYLLRPINSTPFVGFIRENYCRRFIIGHDQKPEQNHRLT